jgi:hypothetical protein
LNELEPTLNFIIGPENATDKSGVKFTEEKTVGGWKLTIV